MPRRSAAVYEYRYAYSSRGWKVGNPAQALEGIRVERHCLAQGIPAHFHMPELNKHLLKVGGFARGRRGLKIHPLRSQSTEVKRPTVSGLSTKRLEIQVLAARYGLRSVDWRQP